MELIQNDIHEQIKLFDDDTFNMIYTNPPYGTTENKWDKPLNWNILFSEMWRVLKPNGIIALHCSMPFTYELIQCDKPKYHYVWIKNNSTNFKYKNKKQKCPTTSFQICQKTLPQWHHPQRCHPI